MRLANGHPQDANTTCRAFRAVEGWVLFGGPVLDRVIDAVEEADTTLLWGVRLVRAQTTGLS